MNEAEGYDVLRLIEHNRNCYVSSEYVEGRPLIQWLKYHPDLAKEQLFLWIHELAKQLEYIHKCRGNPCYRYMNPYSIIITEDKAVYLLDMNAQSNEKQLFLMRRRKVREHFLPIEEAYYQTESVSLDIYGLGKTIQYLLSVSEPDPHLTRREEIRFQKIISKCLSRHSKKSYHQLSEIRRQLPVYHQTKKYFAAKDNFIKKTVILLLLAACAFAVGAGTGIRCKVKRDSQEKEKIETVVKDVQEENKLRKELGFLYFLDKKNYEMSRRYFSGISGEQSAEGMVILTEYMEKGGIAEKEEKLLRTLSVIEEEITEETAENKENYYRCLIEGYRRIDSKKAAEAIIRLGNGCNPEDEAVQMELTSYMAAAYESVADMEQAVEKYKDMLQWESEENFREELYKKLVLLYEDCREKDKAGAVCRQGIHELKESAELRIMHIRMQCEDESIDRNICAQTVREYVNELPGIKNELEFKKLQQEYGIVLEGENVWVGR